MKTRKTRYGSGEDEHASEVHEPAVSYYAKGKMKTSAAGLLGMNAEALQSDGADNIIDAIAYIREGIPKKALDHLAEAASLTTAEVASIVHTSDRTLRRYRPDQKLNTEQSERVMELALLYARGAEVFEDIEQFKIWMDSIVGALGDRKPKTFLDTSMGIQFVADELGRIEQGIFA